MGESLKSEEPSGNICSAESPTKRRSKRIEELLFTDEEFCSRVALAEDDLINDSVLARLNDADAESFQKTLADNPERRFKLELTQALREKLWPEM